MRRIRKYLHDLGTAFDHLWRELTTPAYVRADELAAREFCQKVRALGENPEEALQGAAMVVACGMTSEELMIFAKMSAQRAITAESLHQLEFNHGYLTPFKMKQWRPDGEY